MEDEFQFRRGEPGDIAVLTGIYNHYVTETHATFDTEAFAVGARTQWFTQFSDMGPYRLLVGEIDGVVVGYASSSRFNDRPGYNTSVQTTIYIDPAMTGRGFGKKLYGALLDELIAAPGVHRAYGGVALPNPASVALHEHFGFRLVATFHEVGFKFDRYWDVSWYEKGV